MYWTLSVAYTPGHSGPESDSNERVLCIIQSSIINATSLADGLVSYPMGGWSYPSAEEQLVYSAAPAERARIP